MVKSTLAQGFNARILRGIRSGNGETKRLVFSRSFNAALGITFRITFNSPGCPIRYHFDPPMAIIPKPYREFKRQPPKTGGRERVLAQWRGIDLTPMEMACWPSARSARDLMAGVLVDLRIDQRRAESEILKVWNDMLDPVITAHAQPTGLNKGTLFVTVDSSAWLNEIVRYRRKEILNRLQLSFGRDLIVKISFRAG